MEQREQTERDELVRCLDCGAEYRLPRRVAEAEPCPVCGSPGWVAIERGEPLGERNS
jgi:rRNA maturation endonuclease Nob1